MSTPPPPSPISHLAVVGRNGICDGVDEEHEHIRLVSDHFFQRGKRRRALWFFNMDAARRRGGGGGGSQFVHGRSRVTIDLRNPTMPGRSTSGFQGGERGRGVTIKNSTRYQVWFTVGKFDY